MATYLPVTGPISFLALPTTIVLLGIHVCTISAHLVRVLTTRPAPPPFPHNSVPADILGWWHLDVRWVTQPQGSLIQVLQLPLGAPKLGLRLFLVLRRDLLELFWRGGVRSNA